MTPGIYSAVSGMTARWSQQELSAKNISSADTPGYRRQMDAFGTFDQHLTTALNGQQPGAIVPLAINKGVAYDFSNGAFRATGSPLDVAIEGGGFFQVKYPAGMRLTRAGHFEVNKDGELVDASGYPVQGERGTISVPDKTSRVEIKGDGSVVADGQTIDKLAVFEPQDASKLTAEGGTLFSADNTGVKAVDKPKLATGTLEYSNVQMPTEMVNMIENQRMYDMLAKAVSTQDDSVGKLIQDSAS